MRPRPARGLPLRIVVLIVGALSILAAIPIVLFLKVGFGTAGSSIAPIEVRAPLPARTSLDGAGR